jgi:hypothetical protein
VSAEDDAGDTGSADEVIRMKTTTMVMVTLVGRGQNYW